MRKLEIIKTKTIKGVALAALTLGTLLLNAAGSNHTPGETEKTIKQHVKFPKLILPVEEQHEKIEVIFTTSETGKVNFVLAKTTNKEVKAEIEKQFSALTLTQLKANVAHSVILNFKTI